MTSFTLKEIRIFLTGTIGAVYFGVWMNSWPAGIFMYMAMALACELLPREP